MQRRSVVSAIILAAACGLSACGKNSTPEQSPTDALAELASSGRLPALDVSSTVGGTDAGGNGVRDDLDALIGAQADTAPRRAALTQLARGIQETMAVDATSAAATGLAAERLRAAVACVWTVYDPAAARARVKWIQQLSVNTLVRLAAYEKFDAAMDGSTITLTLGAACDP